ncbi:MAG: tRNA lysidine(34) synthetase TilS [Terracidiphilus sp.]
MPASPKAMLPLDTSQLKPGLRLAVAVSGGADSVALLRSLNERRVPLGLVLHVAHLHHGLRGAEADADLDFVRKLSAKFELPFFEARVDVAAEADRASESIEEAARRMRYLWFRQLMAAGEVDAVATAHTLDDQAETVCAKFLRGAWTEGLSGIHPVVEYAEGRILRPLLAVTRAEVEAYLKALGQDWREDSSNRDAAFTRNRIRHELLPLLEGWNPRLKEHLAQMAELARGEEAWWRAEVNRVAAQIVMTGRPVRGGGRASGEALALDATRLAALAPALQRRLLRHAVSQLGLSLDYPSTETLRILALEGRAGQRRELSQGLRAERTPRELRLTVEAPTGGAGAPAEYELAIPGEIEAPAFGVCLRIEAKAAVAPGNADPNPPKARLRNWRPGDRVLLRYSSGPRKVKEVLERMRVTGSSRAVWPVLEVAGRIVWMKGVELEPEPGILVSLVAPLTDARIGAVDVAGDASFE